jgi:radical SAM protein with 4Fe4S-binding SPASM domain
MLKLRVAVTVLVAVAVVGISGRRKAWLYRQAKLFLFMIMKMKIRDTEIYLIPTKGTCTKENVDNFIAYSPLNKACYAVDKNEVNQLISYVEKGNMDTDAPVWMKDLLDYELLDISKKLHQNPNEYTTLSLLTNLVCNFRCRYCYSAAGRSSVVIDKEKLKRALDFFIDPERIKPQVIKIFISGGGEPLLSWNNTKFAISYAWERAKKYKFTLWISIVTNGTVVNEDIVGTLKKYKCSVCISFEVLEDIQNYLRGHYEKVAASIVAYGEADIPVMLNSTVTPLSVTRMNEMVEEVLEKYPFVRNYTLEPVTDHTQFDTPESMRYFYEQFNESYRMIKKRYGHSPTSLWFSLDEMIDTVKMRYCPGKLCLTPHATFSICHCTSSPLEERYEKCVYGKVTDKEVVFDIEKFRYLVDINAWNREKCRDCFAKWNCGGECMTRLDQYPEAYMEEVCRFNREWLTMQLEGRLNDYKCKNYTYGT